MASTVSLRRFTQPPLVWEIQPLARLKEGVLEPEGVWLPPEGPARVVVWRPGGAPPFALALARVVRAGAGWRVEGSVPDGWVVLVEPADR